MIEFYNRDCLEALKEYENNYFDLAIVDPPYGSSWDAIDKKNGETNKATRKKYHLFKDKAPDQEYFDELKRVSKNQIVWGANFFDVRGLSGGVSVGIKRGRLSVGLSMLIALK